jgi:hypothetical protein
MEGVEKLHNYHSISWIVWSGTKVGNHSVMTKQRQLGGVVPHSKKKRCKGPNYE